LSYGRLEIAGKSGPCSTTVDTELRALTLGSKAEQLAEYSETLFINTSCGFKHQSSELILGVFEISIVILVLLGLSVVLTGVRTRQVVDGERTGDSNVNGQAESSTPKRHGYITRSASWCLGFSEDALLLHNRCKPTLCADRVQQIAKAIVAVNEISILSAACGVVAKIIDDLLTQRTRDFLRHHRETKTKESSNLEVPGLHQSVLPVKGGRHGRDPSASMLALQRCLLGASVISAWRISNEPTFCE